MQARSTSGASGEGVDVKALYPSLWSVLFWSSVAAVRWGVLCTVATMWLQPRIVALADAAGWTDFATFVVTLSTLQSAIVFFGGGFFYLCERRGWFASARVP